MLFQNPLDGLAGGPFTDPNPIAGSSDLADIDLGLFLEHLEGEVLG
jgi:hypothetical protein